MEIGDALKRFRTEFAGLSQKQVTTRIGIAVPQQWQKYEYKQAIPSAEVIVKLAKEFDVSADYLLGLSDKPCAVPANKILTDAVTDCRDRLQRVLDEFGRLNE